MPESAQSSPVLTPFGKYLLDEEIARGGMARVYLARLRGLGGFEKKLVVKQVRPELASDPRFVEMFVEEAKTLVQMSHPHIVPVYELGVVDGVYFLAMEHVEGATLAEMLREGGPLSPALAAHVGVQVSEALQYAHGRFELVHRDVTPRNVIVDGLGHVRLLDFGIAAHADGMLAGEVFGSHGYMSPEQARGEPLGPRSDLFSLGAVLYEALSGEPAFLRDDDEATQRALDADPPSLRGREGIPEPLVELIDELLRREPDARPASASEVVQRLRSWLSASRPEGVAPELAARAEAARRTRRRTRSTPPPARDGSGDPSDVRSIATSVTLQQLLEPETARAGDDGERDSHADQGTVPLPRRNSGTVPRNDTFEDGTRPLSTRRAPAAEEVARRRTVPKLLAGVVAVAVAAWIAWPSASEAPEGVAEEPGPVEAPPEEVAAERGVGEARAATEAEAETEAAAEAGSEGVTETAPPEETRPPEVAPRATVTVNSTPWSHVLLDGRRVGTTPLRSLRVAPGRHVLVLRSPPLGKEARVELQAAAGRTTRVIVDLSADPPRVTVR